ncbi:hypothetical protein ABPG72_020203 [Tetrahymena utriculariae]
MKQKNLTSDKTLKLDKKSISIDDQIAEKYFENISSQSKDLIILIISFSSNKIEDQGASHFAQQISQCLNLSQLRIDFSFNKIKESGFMDLCNSLGNCLKISSLQLDLTGNMIADNGFQQKPKQYSLIHLNNIIIYLGQNKIGDRGASFLTKTILQCENVNTLNLCLEKNEISDQGSLILAAGIAQCTNLTQLKVNFDIQEMKSQTKQDFFSSLQTSKINQLSFGFQINSSISNELMTGISEIKSLCHRKLSFDQIQDKESEVIAKKQENQSIQDFQEFLSGFIDICTTNHSSLFEFNNFLCHLINLKSFVFSYWDRLSFENSDICYLSRGIACCENLENLEMEFNELSDKNISVLGEGISKCKKLTNLKLEFMNNQILDQGIFYFLEGLSKAVLLESIKLTWVRIQFVQMMHL